MRPASHELLCLFTQQIERGSLGRAVAVGKKAGLFVIISAKCLMQQIGHNSGGRISCI